MKKLLYLLIGFFLFLDATLTTYAKPQLKVVKQGGFVDLSTEDQQDTVTALVSEISNDLQIATVPRLYFYSAKEWPLAASYYQGLDYIYVNMSTFEDSMDADLSNETVIHVKTEKQDFLQFRRLLQYSDIISHCYSLGLNNNY